MLGQAEDRSELKSCKPGFSWSCIVPFFETSTGMDPCRKKHGELSQSFDSLGKGGQR